MSKKQALTGLAATLAAIASVFAFIPQARPFGELLLFGADVAKTEASKQPEIIWCAPTVCGYDAKAGQNSTHGTIGFTDGGVSCECK